MELPNGLTYYGVSRPGYLSEWPRNMAKQIVLIIMVDETEK